MARVDLGNDWWELDTGTYSEIELHLPLIAGLQRERANTEWQEMVRLKPHFAATGRFVKQELARFEIASYIDGSGATWEVRLYNVTDASQMALITVTATTPTCQSAVFSLPFAEKEICVQARQISGDAHDLNVTHAMLCWSSVL